MTKNDQESNNRTKGEAQGIANGNKQQQSAAKIRLGKFIFLFVVAIGLVIYGVIAYKDSWLSSINNLNPFGLKPVTSQDQTGKNRYEDESSTKPGEEEGSSCEVPGENLDENNDDLLKFAPENDEDDDQYKEDDDLNPYDKEGNSEKDSIGDLIMAENLINNLNDYRIYLANANEMIMKLAKNMSYSENLAIIMQVEMPPEIDEIAKMCAAYDEMLSTGKPLFEKVDVFSHRLFDRFLKVNRETEEYKKMQELKAKIEAKIELFARYVFSPEVQGMFLR